MGKHILYTGASHTRTAVSGVYDLSKMIKIAEFDNVQDALAYVEDKGGDSIRPTSLTDSFFLSGSATAALILNNFLRAKGLQNQRV